VYEKSIIGEFSFIDGRMRSASALVTVDAVLLGLDRKDVDVLVVDWSSPRKVDRGLTVIGIVHTPPG
jgi:hypothetical protein